MANGDPQAQEQVVWALGNIAGDSITNRDGAHCARVFSKVFRVSLISYFLFLSSALFCSSSSSS